MRPGQKNPVYGGASQKSGFNPGPSKAGKSRAAMTGGGPADYIGGPQPVPYPGAQPHPVPAPMPQRPHPAPAAGGRVPPMPMPPAGVGGQAYAPPGIAQHDLLSLLISALRPDEF